MHPAYMQPYTHQQYVPGSGGQYGTGALEVVGQFGPPVPAPPHPMAPHPILAHPHHPQFGWRGHGGGPPVVFAGYPGGGVAYGGAPAVVERPLRDIREYPLGFFQSGIGVCTGAIDWIRRICSTVKLDTPMWCTSPASLISFSAAQPSSMSASGIGQWI